MEKSGLFQEMWNIASGLMTFVTRWALALEAFNEAHGQKANDISCMPSSSCGLGVNHSICYSLQTQSALDNILLGLADEACRRKKQILDLRSYPGHSMISKYIGMWITDNFARKSWRMILKTHRPDAVFFLGDLLDSGVEGDCYFFFQLTASLMPRIVAVVTDRDEWAHAAFMSSQIAEIAVFQTFPLRASFSEVESMYEDAF